MTGIVAKYYQLKRNDRKLFWEALRKLYWCKIMLLFISFKKCAQRYKSTGTRTDANEFELVSIRRAINRANRLVFWRNKCLVNTICARWMLNRRNIQSEAYLGVKKEAGNTKAHAWIISNSIKLVHEDQSYSIIYTF